MAAAFQADAFQNDAFQIVTTIFQGIGGLDGNIVTYAALGGTVDALCVIDGAIEAYPEISGTVH